MGWERRGKGWYYYRKRKVGRRVVSEYVGAGSGLFGPLRALIAEETLALRAATRAARAGARAALESAAAEDGAWFDRLESVTREALEAAGYRQHERGKWRKRRMSRTNGISQGNPAGPAPVPTVAPAILTSTVEKALLAQFLPHDPAGRRSVAAEMERLRAELGGPDPSPLERLLIG